MKIKICGITRKDEIEVLNELKPDYIGFVFAESKRQVKLKEAEYLYNMLKKEIKAVGVFRNNQKEFVEEIIKNIPLYALQFHGDEDIEYIKYFKNNYPVSVWKGISIKSKEDLIKADKLPVDTLVVDGKSPGGGKVFPWEYLKEFTTNKEILLAGGINETNIEEALQIKNIQGIDVSSGVESIVNGLRKKDSKKMISIIRKVRKRNER